MDPNRVYVRFLELQSIISEELGEAIKELNDYSWKKGKRNNETLERAFKEIGQMYSPMMELQALIESTMKLNKNQEKKDI